MEKEFHDNLEKMRNEVNNDIMSKFKSSVDR